MKTDVLKRIQALQKKLRKNYLPIFVMIHYDEEKEKWIAQETYYHDVKGLGTFKKIELNHYNDYKMPEGFNGPIIIDNMFEADEILN